MTDYPDREHRAEDESARRRAAVTLDQIKERAELLGRKLAGGGTRITEDASELPGLVFALARDLAIVESMANAAEWLAAAEEERERARFEALLSDKEHLAGMAEVYGITPDETLPNRLVKEMDLAKRVLARMDGDRAVVTAAIGAHGKTTEGNQ